MAGASFKRALSVPATPEAAWAVVTDVSRLASWVEVLETVTELIPLASYKTVIADRLGPFKLRADLGAVDRARKLFEGVRRLTVDLNDDVTREDPGPGGRAAAISRRTTRSVSTPLP